MEYYTNDYSDEEFVFNDFDEEDEESSQNTLERQESILGTSMTTDGRFVVGDDDVRVIELLAKCAGLKTECDKQRQKKEKARAKSAALTEQLKQLKSKLSVERRRNQDLEKSLANKDRELVEVLGTVQTLERLVQTGSEGSASLHRALSNTLQQERVEFESKKTKASRSKTKLTQELENLWLKYEALRQSYELVEAQCAKSENKNTTYALHQQEFNAIKDELLQQNKQLEARVKSYEESLSHLREEQESMSIKHRRKLTAVQEDLEKKTNILENNKEETQNLRKQSMMMANKLLDFQYRQSMFELPIRRWMVEQINPTERDQEFDVQLAVVKIPATKDITLRIRQNVASAPTQAASTDEEKSETTPAIPYEVRIPICDVVAVHLLDRQRFRISTEDLKTYTFTTPNAATIVEDLRDIQKIDLTPEVGTSPNMDSMRPKTNVSEALEDLFDL